MKLKYRLLIFVIFYLLLIGGTICYYLSANDIFIFRWVLLEIISIYVMVEYV